MIITIKGTSGSGKSTVVREIMKCYTGTRIPYRVRGRKQPIGYVLHRNLAVKSIGQLGQLIPLAIVGHYESPCGGCDTINKIDDVFELVRKSHAAGMDVLFEGLLLSAEFNRTYALHKDGMPVTVIGLDVPIDICLDSVNKRRRKKDPKKPPVNPKNTVSKHKGTINIMRRLKDAGVDAVWTTRNEAIELIKQKLNIGEPK